MKKYAIFFVLSSISIIFFGCLDTKSQTNQTSMPTAQVASPTHVPDLINSSWNYGHWQNFEFEYPTNFKLTLGNLNETFFYLDYLGLPENTIRIYGISEDWNYQKETTTKISRPIDRAINSRLNGDHKGFPEYSKISSEWLSNNTYQYCFFFKMESEPKLKSCTYIRDYKEKIRLFTIIAPAETWDRNTKSFERISPKLE